MLAGGSVSGALAYGASDRLGAFPTTQPVTPGDLAATIFWRFGLGIRQDIQDPLGRPQRLATGEPILGVFSREESWHTHSQRGNWNANILHARITSRPIKAGNDQSEPTKASGTESGHYRTE